MANLSSLMNNDFKIIDFFSEKLFETVALEDFMRFCEANDISFCDFEIEYINNKYAHLSNGELFLDFSNDFVKMLKRTRDAHLVNRLNRNIVEEIYTSKKLLLRFKEKIETLFLIGSAARNKMKKGSDIDFLLVCKGNLQIKKINLAKKIQTVQYDISEFNERYKSYGEIVFWALKYGLILYDDEFIFDYYQPEIKFISSNILIDKRLAIGKISKRIRNSKFFNDDKLRSELIKLVYQIARFKLLKIGEMPKSRKEIIGQILKIDPEIAETILNFENRNIGNRNAMLKTFYRIDNNFKIYLLNDDS